MNPNSQRFLFDAPAIYRICVQGHLAPRWVDILAGMTACARRRRGKPAVTTLTGTLVDQASLMGVLTALYDRGYTLLDVQRLPDPVEASAEDGIVTPSPNVDPNQF